MEQPFLKFDEFPNTELLERCVADVTNSLVEYPEIILYGKVCHQRRCVGFFSDDITGYHYSGQKSYSEPMTKSLNEMLSLVNNMYKAKYNGILVNKYKNGNDYISAHSDDEYLCDVSGVVAVSYGATRKFRIRNKHTKKKTSDFELISGSMLQMGGSFQQEFTHEIPVQKKVKNERISFTFRKHNK